MRGAVVSFPSTYAGIPTARLIAIYGEGPARLRAALSGLSLAELRARPIPDRWSMLEIAAHVADSELMGSGRVRLVFSQEETTLIGYDQDVWAKRLAYQSFDEPALERSLVLFEVLRAANRAVYERASSDDWLRWGTHTEFGPLTLRNILELYADHVERHLGQILARRDLLGRHLEMPLLLEERLY